MIVCYILILVLIIYFYYSKPWIKICKDIFYNLIFRIPYFRKYQEEFYQEKNKFAKSTEKLMFEYIEKIYDSLPDNGLDEREIYSRWDNNNNNINLSDDIITNIFKLCSRSNKFQIERQNKAEIINIYRQSFHGNDEVTGVITDINESLLMVCLAARNRAYDLYNITDPEIIVPESAHMDFDKAGSYFNIKIIRVKLDYNYKVNIPEIKLAINKNTILIVGSMPSFSHGIIDPIDKLSELVEEYKGRIGLHIDACSYGHLLPFINNNNFNNFNMNLSNITSLSVDTYKIYNLRGISVLLYRNSDWRKYQYSINSEWIGGISGTSNMLGNYNDISINMVWAAIMNLGKKGHTSYTKRIIKLTKNIIAKIKEIDELEILGDPQLNVIAFTFKKDIQLNIYDLQDQMKQRKWFLNELQYPDALHICITDIHTQIEDFVPIFINDLKESISDLKLNTNITGSTVKLYEKIRKIPNRFVKQLIELYFDINYQYKPKYSDPLKLK